ncbi:unnamed protein product [Candida verbasci]|uniref:Protein kinase domain-containing protein n=1 Tax=Candida verbasci TaxID=1227364 RepID=A0A9W4TW12_9ASCO|nr:unnamed protein product [Candida verbasci]
MDEDKLSIILDQSSNKKVINNEYKIIKKIGQGQYGKVLLGELTTKSNSYVAIKTINRIDKKRLITKNYMSSISKIRREISIMKECNHPNVVKLYKVIDDLKFDKILLILEYCKFGEIDWRNYNHYYEKYNKPKALILNKILRDVLNGLEYLHCYKNIIHRDLKPSNLLIDQNGTIKISDFGVSLIIENNSNDDVELAKIMGTPAFYAPELCQFVNNRYSIITNKDHEANKIKIDYRIDIWSLGITLYCLMFNNLPFNGKNEFEMCKNIVNQELKFPVIKHSKRVKEEDIEELKHFKSLVKKILVKNANDRISIEEIKHHSFTTYDLNTIEIKKFLNFNKAIFKDADCKKQISNNQELNLSTRLKNFFKSNNGEPSLPLTPPPKISPSTSTSTSNSNSNSNSSNLKSNYKDLHHVDDLLDSYLDDSSSESIEEDIDTTNILNDLDIESPTKKHIPEPLNLKDISSYKLTTSSTPTNNELSPYKQSSSITPTNNNITIIGESSPSRIISFFSPSKRFFKRNQLLNDSYNPTISSLSSPIGENKQQHFDLIEPPSIFRKRVNDEEDNNNKQDNSNSNSNSNSNFYGTGLRKLSSSSSSLNLNAYLTDESDSISIKTKGKKKICEKITKDEDEGDSTLIFDDSEIRNIKGMDEYLNSLN